MNIDEECPKKFKATHAGRRHECFGYIVTGVLLVAIPLGVAANVLPRQILDTISDFSGTIFLALIYNRSRRFGLSKLATPYQRHEEIMVRVHAGGC